MISENHEREIIVPLPVEHRYRAFLKGEIGKCTSILLSGNISTMEEYSRYVGTLRAYQKSLEMFSRYDKEL